MKIVDVRLRYLVVERAGVLGIVERDQVRQTDQVHGTYRHIQTAIAAEARIAALREAKEHDDGRSGKRPK